MKPKGAFLMNKVIFEEHIEKAEQVLIDNGIDEDEAAIVLQAIGYVLLDAELYDESNR